MPKNTILMRIENKILLHELTTKLNEAKSKVEDFKKLDGSKLNFKENPEKWSILECVEHLNLYGDFYIPEIEKVIAENLDKKGDGNFKSGWIGNYFANSMKVNNGKVSKMKTFKDKNPSNSSLDVLVLDRFLKQADELVRLMELSKDLNLSRIKNSISISKWLKLRLGDTFRFVVYHIERHIWQAENVNF